MHIRRAAVDDSQTLATLNMDVQRLHHENAPGFFKPPSDGPEMVAWFAAQLADPALHGYIACEGDEPAGYILCRVMTRPENPFTYTLRVLYIDQISVRPAYRGKGCGARLIQQAVELAKAEGIERVALDVWRFNEGARAFFAAQGFTAFHDRMGIVLRD